MQDGRGNPLSTQSAAAVAALDEATALIAAFHGDPVGMVVNAIKQQPDFIMGHCFLASVFATSVDRAFDGYFRRGLEAAEALAAKANDRERLYIAACRHWAGGDFAKAADTWGAIAKQWPRDIFALQMTQQADFYLGRTTMLRDRIADALPHWSPDLPSYGAVLGMLAFGQEECGQYRKAEESGRRAVELDARDAWAIHAVAHVMEMEGRASEGVAWLSSNAQGFSPEGLLACHAWWHLALAHIENGDVGSALALYDREILPLGLKTAQQLSDAAALLWRLTVLGHETGTRWAEVAEKWKSRAGDGLYAFNDMHAAMAFAAMDDGASTLKLVATNEKAAAGQGSNALMAREVGLPVIHGIGAFARGDYDTALTLLADLLPKAYLFGGSHAQRDVIQWTAVEAAIRAGKRSVAEKLNAQRLAQKPYSPVNRAWAARIAAAA